MLGVREITWNQRGDPMGLGEIPAGEVMEVHFYDEESADYFIRHGTISNEKSDGKFTSLSLAGRAIASRKSPLVVEVKHNLTAPMCPLTMTYLGI